MKRFFALLIALLWLVCGAGCGSVGVDDNTDVSHVTDVSDDSYLPSLQDILTEADAVLMPGTAGSSLKAARMAALLMDWSATCPDGVSQDKLAAVLQTVEAANPNAPMSLSDRLSEVDSMHNTLRVDTAILADCGYEGSGGPWSDSDLAAYELLMAAAGLR